MSGWFIFIAVFTGEKKQAPQSYSLHNDVTAWMTDWRVTAGGSVSASLMVAL